MNLELLLILAPLVALADALITLYVHLVVVSQNKAQHVAIEQVRADHHTGRREAAELYRSIRESVQKS